MRIQSWSSSSKTQCYCKNKKTLFGNFPPSSDMSSQNSKLISIRPKLATHPAKIDSMSNIHILTCPVICVGLSKEVSLQEKTWHQQKATWWSAYLSFLICQFPGHQHPSWNHHPTLQGNQHLPPLAHRQRHTVPNATDMSDYQVVLVEKWWQIDKLYCRGDMPPPCSSRNIWKPFLALIFWFSMTSVYSNWRHTWMRSSVSPESFHLRRKTEIFQSVLASSRMNWLVLSWISSLWIDMGYVHDINKLNRQTLYENLGGFLEVHLLEETFFVKPPWAHGSWSEI